MNAISASLALFLAAASAAAPVGVDQVLVRVNGVPIRQAEVVELLLKRYGAQTVDELIDEALLRQAAKKEGVAADDAEIDRRVVKLQDRLGSREVFLAQLEQSGTSMAKVKEDIADEIVYERLVSKAKSLTVGDAELKRAFEAHLAETRNHVQRVEQVFRMHGVEAEAVTCPAIDGIIKEADEVAGEVADKKVLDAALIAAAQAVEHYEIARYGTLIAWARELGRDDCASVLKQNLADETAADKKLTDIAETRVNRIAA